jgi:hypothetical protein
MTKTPIRLIFKIDAYTPQTIPMARLAEYMADVADLIGERANVHFVEVGPGSVQLVHDVQYEAYPKVEARAASIQNGDAPAEAVKAYRALNKRLAEDNTSATYLTRKTGSAILDFPGVRAPKPIEIKPVEQPSTVDGQIVQVGGRVIKAKVPLLIDTGDGIVPCTTSRILAKELRNFFLEEERRFYGRGQWAREETGAWTLNRFEITAHEALDQRPLSALVDELRDVPSGFSELVDPWGDLIALRRDEGELH